jgi:hypothetical protein
VAAVVCLVDALTLLLFVRLCRHHVLKAVLLELFYDDRPCRVAHAGLAERTERDDMTDHTKNLLIVLVLAGYASLVVAVWQGYVKEPYFTLIQVSINPPAALGYAGFLLYKDWLERLGSKDRAHGVY